MKNQLLITLLILVASGSIQNVADEPKIAGFRIVGYLPDYRLPNFDAATAQGLTDLNLFSAELSQDGSLDLARLKKCPWQKLTALRKSTGLCLMLTIGGWERSKHFSTVSASPAKRKKCVASILKFVIEKGFDGIDLDWEHPLNRMEEDAYAALLQEIHESFKPHGFRLTVTIASWQRLHAAAILAVDRVQVMSYDKPGEHSTLEQAKADLKRLTDSQIPSEKVVLGLPLYGRNVTSREAISYADIVAKYDPKPSTDLVDGIYFNGPDTIRNKIRLAIDSNLAGVMVWELGQDTLGERAMLKVIRRNVTSALPSTDKHEP